jgi:ATP-dependent DNA ligase
MGRQRQLKRSAAVDVFLGLFGAYGLLAVIPTQTWHAGTTVVYRAAKLAMVALPRHRRLGFRCASRYSKNMPAPSPRTSGFIDPCILARAHKPPAGPDWVHSIKHDGYRLQVRRAGDAVRLFTRRGYDWSGRYPAITLTAMQLRADSFTLDAEAVGCGPDGIAIFDALHRHGTVSDPTLYAFDLLELEGRDLRALPLRDRKEAAGEARRQAPARHRH